MLITMVTTAIDIHSTSLETNSRGPILQSDCHNTLRLKTQQCTQGESSSLPADSLLGGPHDRLALKLKPYSGLVRYEPDVLWGKKSRAHGPGFSLKSPMGLRPRATSRRADLSFHESSPVALVVQNHSDPARRPFIGVCSSGDVRNCHHWQNSLESRLRCTQVPHPVVLCVDRAPVGLNDIECPSGPQPGITGTLAPP